MADVRRRLRELAPRAAMAGGVLWVIAVNVLGFALVLNDGRFLMTCPSDGPCEWAAAVPKWLTVSGMAVGVISFVLVGLSLLGFLQWDLGRLVRSGLWLMLIGLPLVFALGMGLMFFVPGLLVVAVGLRGTSHWKGPALMLIALVATFFVAEPIDDPGEKSVALMGSVTGTITVIGIGWTMFGVSARRDGDISTV
jgi:hypothetical protein